MPDQKKKCRVLWIEDNARRDLSHLIAPVIMDGGYDLVVAETASDGANRLRRGEFQVIIVDIRLDPGRDREWIEAFQKSGRDKVTARLGLKLLYAILGQGRAEEFEWITADKVGVFTVESHMELSEDLKELGITAYRQKQAGAPDTVLLDFIKQVQGKLTSEEKP